MSTWQRRGVNSCLVAVIIYTYVVSRTLENTLQNHNTFRWVYLQEVQFWSHSHGWDTFIKEKLCCLYKEASLGRSHPQMAINHDSYLFSVPLCPKHSGTSCEIFKPCPPPQPQTHWSPTPRIPHWATTIGLGTNSWVFSKFTRRVTLCTFPELLSHCQIENNNTCLWRH